MLGLTEKQTKRFNTVMKLNEKNPDKYCWSALHDVAVETDRETRGELKEYAKSLHFCNKDLESNGSCWCGKLRK